jgi:hypothetical protein
MAIDIVSGARKTIPHAFREVLLLEGAQKAAEKRSAEQQAKIRELTEAVGARTAAAESLSAFDQIPAALVLLRDATVLAIHALLVAHGSAPPEPTIEAAFRELGHLIDSGAVPAPPDGLVRARELLTNRHHLAFDELATTEAVDRRADVESTLRWLRNQVDPRSVRQIQLSRWMRLAGVALAVAGGAAWLAFWGTGKLFAAKNIALGATVQLSSRRPDCPAGSGPSGAPPSGLVDGSKSSSYDICTNSEVNPWAIVDLHRSERLAKIKIYGRGDCCWGTYDLPTLLEISQDGNSYVEIARRTTPYSASDPWVVDAGAQPARFIRLRSDSPAARELVLNEVEVFAAK